MSALGRIGGGLVFGLVAMLLAGGAEAANGFFKVNSGDWTNTANWSAYPSLGSTDARIGATSPGVNPATAAIHAGDTVDCYQLYIGINAKTGLLTIAGGQLTAATGTWLTYGNAGDNGTINQSGGTFNSYDCFVGCAVGSTGIYNMTSGVLTNTAIKLQNGYGEFNIANDAKIYGRSGGETRIGDAGGIGKVTMIGGYWDNNNQYTRVSYSAGSYGVFDISGGTFTNARISSGPGGGRGEIKIRGTAIFDVNEMALAQANTSTTLVTVAGGDFVDRGDLWVTYTAGSGTLTLSNGTVTVLGITYLTANGGRGTVNILGGTWKGSTTYMGRDSGETARFNIYGGEVFITNNTSSINVGYNSGSNDCLLTMTNGLLVHNSTSTEGITVGYKNGATGTVSFAGGIITNYKSLYVGRQSGSRGTVIQNGGTWDQLGLTSVGEGGSGRFVQSNGVFRAANVTISNPGSGSVELWGTNRTFQVGGTLTINASGAITNHVQGCAGGVDITNSAAAVTMNGNIHVAFEQDPKVVGPYWGLRWAGNHTNTFATWKSGGNLTVATNALSSYWQPKVGIFYDGTNSFVGIQNVTTVTHGTLFMVE